MELNKKYQIIYADPPWQFYGNECLAKKSLLSKTNNNHYSTMALSELKQLPIKNIKEKKCLLFLWVVSSMLDDGISVMKGWGFKYSTIGFVWYKQRSNPGHYILNECEICIIGRCGGIPQPRGARNIRQFLSSKREIHSKKPDEIRMRIEQMFPQQSKIELFARQRTEGWDAWGNEVKSDIIL